MDETEASAERVVPTPGHATPTPGVTAHPWEPWLLEGLAQTAAVLNGHNEHATGRRSRKGMLVGIRNLQITRCPRAGETVRYEVALIKRISPLTLLRGQACVGDEVVAQGEMKFYVEAEAAP